MSNNIIDTVQYLDERDGVFCDCSIPYHCLIHIARGNIIDKDMMTWYVIDSIPTGIKYRYKLDNGEWSNVIEKKIESYE